ncbi:hypothetical protein OUZ56_030168 [Daphnia magna]|uniref:RRM domain-containing protein n=1 Tax=Daphnia magna TaxID=35525 RepID=A0ABQ9ZQH2_9CRUS|nr:hypothetical protein OUZ56_030168 [Daphnia magna]
MPRFSAFPPPPPLPGTKKAFPEVRGRALPPGVTRITATEARTPSPLAFKTPLYASAPLKKPDEASFFRSKIPVRILASTTFRLDHQDHDIPKGEDDQDISANRSRSAPRAKFVSRIPVRKVTIGRARSVTLPTQSYTVSAPVNADSLIVPEIHDVPQDGWREEMPLADSLVVVHQEPCSGDDQPGETAIQSGGIELEAATDSQLNSGTVPPPTGSQKRNIALRERRKAKKRVACLMANKVPSSAPTVDATLEDEQNPAASPVALETSDSDKTSVASASVDAELIHPNFENHQEKKKSLKPLEEGHPPFLPYVFVMDCLRPFVPQPTHEVKAEPQDEYLHVSNVPFSVPSEEVVAYFQKLAGPVKFFSMHLNEDGVYSGKASIIFCRPDDARKALLLYDETPLYGRKLKLKLFVDGERVYPNHVPLPELPGIFKVDWVNPPARNMVVLPSVNSMTEFMAEYPTNFLLNDCQRLWASSVVHVEHIVSGGLYDFARSHLVKDCSNTSLLHYQLFDSFDQDCGLQL